MSAKKKTAKRKPAKTATASRATKAKAAAAVTAKKMSLLDAAAQVLAKAGEPMNTRAMVDAVYKAKLWSSPAGLTPHATLYAGIIKEIATKGRDARFTKTEPGKFAVTA